jgi:hypothetical protein
MMAAAVHLTQAVLLEDDFPGQLHLAGAVNSRGDNTKVLAILAAIRDTPYRMVEGIERVHPQLQLQRFEHWELSEDRSVEILVAYIPHISDSISRQFRHGHSEPS